MDERGIRARADDGDEPAMIVTRADRGPAREAESLNLSRGGRREGIDELDPARTLVVGQPLTSKPLQVRGQFGIRCHAGLQNHVRDRLDECIAIRSTGDPQACTAGCSTIACSSSAGLTQIPPTFNMSSDRPANRNSRPHPGGTCRRCGSSDLDRVLRLLVTVPVIGTGRIAAYQQVADLPGRDRRPVVIDEPGFVPANRHATRTGADAPGLIGNEDMKYFG